MNTTAAQPSTTCPPFSAGGDTCPYCGAYVGEYGYLRTHTTRTRQTAAAQEPTTAKTTRRTFRATPARAALQQLMPAVEVSVVGGTLRTAKQEARRQAAPSFRGEVVSLFLVSTTRS